MNVINKIPLGSKPVEYNEFRFKQSGKDNNYYRNLTIDEIELLELGKNRCDDWSQIVVKDKFNPDQIKNCYFSGLVRIDEMDPVYLEFHDLILPVGLYNSKILSSDIGKNCIVYNVSYLSKVILGEEVILKDINELVISDHAKFGNGIVKDGENPKGRIELEIANEAGGREVLPFCKMNTIDAYLWYKFRDRPIVMEKFKEFVDKDYSSKRGFYGLIGDRTVIKNCRILKDVTIGTDAYIKGSSKLKNLTIKSNREQKTQIGEGVVLVNGIVGAGCRIFYSAIAVRFQLMQESSLKYGARLLNSILGENSTISCCEVLNSLIYPGHEQHHNSSFLIASVLKGQTNIASGATVGSNHNSRANDGELVAGRGFWPGLNCSLKHDSKFSTFNMVVKGNYNHEINNPFPFSLISLNSDNKVQVFPGYWFSYNMYALKRNSWKYGVRDKRSENFPQLDYDFLAPDTVSEMISSVGLLEELASESYKKISGKTLLGKDLLDKYKEHNSFPIYSSNIENKNDSVLIIKPEVAYKLYKDMINLYAVSKIIEFVNFTNSSITNSSFKNNKRSLENPNKWINCGGQFIPQDRLFSILDDVELGNLDSWDSIHNRYKEIASLYTSDRSEHAIYCLEFLYGPDISSDIWHKAIKRAVETRVFIRDEVYKSRKKDFESSFRKITFNNIEEKDSVIGSIDSNSFFAIENIECEDFVKLTEREDLKKIF